MKQLKAKFITEFLFLVFGSDYMKLNFVYFSLAQMFIQCIFYLRLKILNEIEADVICFVGVAGLKILIFLIF